MLGGNILATRVSSSRTLASPEKLRPLRALSVGKFLRKSGASHADDNASARVTALAARAGATFLRAAVEPAMAAAGRVAEHVRRPSAVRIERDIFYHRDQSRSHRLDLYWPPSAERPLPVVFYIHGGGFQTMSKSSHWYMALPFATRGFLVVSINYRMLPGYAFPAALFDCAVAFEWMVGHAAVLGLDVDRVVLAGDSAGANLAASLALLCCFRRPEPWARRVFDLGVVARALISCYGLLQVSDPGRFRRDSSDFSRLVDLELLDLARSYLDVDPRLPASSLELADPLLVFESDAIPDRPLPACLAAVGTGDPLRSDTDRLEAAWLKRGASCVAHRYTGQPHAFSAALWSEAVTRFWADTQSFLDSHVGRAGRNPEERRSLALRGR